MIADIKHFLFLTDLLGKNIDGMLKGTGFGRIVDVIVHPKEIYPEVTKLVVSPGWFKDNVIIPWENIMPFELPARRLVAKTETTTQPFALNGNELMLKETFLDKQIVDVAGCKVVRVNDLHLLKEQNKIWVVHMDIGFRGISRRLGWEKNLDYILEWIFSYKLPEQFLSWKYVQQIPVSADHFGPTALKLTTTCQRLNELHPADLAEILMDLDRYERVALFSSLDTVTAAEVLVELKIDIQRRLIEGVERGRRVEVIGLMLPDKAADLLSHLPQKRREEIMKHLPPLKVESLKGLIAHPEQTAGSLMTNQFISLTPELTVDEALMKVREKAGQVKALYYIYVVDQNNILLGVVTLRRLLSSPATAKLGEIMNTKIIKVKPSNSDRRVARIFVKYNFGAIPVVDVQNKLTGIIMFKDVVDKISQTMVREDK